MTELDDINIRHFKLASGEEIVSLVSGVEDSLLILESPMAVHETYRDEAMTYMLTRWQPLAKDHICYINPAHIVSQVECADDIKERYVRLCIEERRADSDNLSFEGDGWDGIESEYDEEYDIDNDEPKMVH